MSKGPSRSATIVAETEWKLSLLLFDNMSHEAMPNGQDADVAEARLHYTMTSLMTYTVTCKRSTFGADALVLLQCLVVLVAT